MDLDVNVYTTRVLLSTFRTSVGQTLFIGHSVLTACAVDLGVGLLADVRIVAAGQTFEWMLRRGQSTSWRSQHRFDCEMATELTFYVVACGRSHFRELHQTRLAISTSSELAVLRLSDRRVALAVVLSAVGDVLYSWVLIGRQLLRRVYLVRRHKRQRQHRFND